MALKKELDSILGGLSLMILFTIMWTVIAEISLQNLDHRIVGIAFGLIILLFVYYYLKFSRAGKSIAEPPSHSETADDKKRGKWFWIIFAAEGFLILLAKNILLNTGHDNLFIPCFALIVGLHFFPLARVFKRKFDYFIAVWTTTIAIIGLVLLIKGGLNERIVKGSVGIGCAFATSCYGFKMIYEGRKITRL
jgi:hypothetical protein